MNKALKMVYMALIFVGIVSFIMTILTANQWWQLEKINEYIRHPGENAQVSQHPYAMFAKAYYQMEKGQQQKALDILTKLHEQADERLKVLVLYNRGNIYLKQALALGSDDKKRISLIELAKQDYREALALAPQLQEARFNLELALNLLPEKEQEALTQKKPNVLNKKTIESYGFRADLP